MADSTILGADPDALAAHAAEARSLIGLASPAIGPYRATWSALATAPASPPLCAPGDKAGRVAEAMGDLRDASASVEGYGEAHRALDASADGELDSDELPNPDHLELFRRAREGPRR